MSISEMTDLIEASMELSDAATELEQHASIEATSEAGEVATSADLEQEPEDDGYAEGYDDSREEARQHHETRKPLTAAQMAERLNIANAVETRAQEQAEERAAKIAAIRREFYEGTLTDAAELQRRLADADMTSEQLKADVETLNKRVDAYNRMAAGNAAFNEMGAHRATLAEMNREEASRLNAFENECRPIINKIHVCQQRIDSIPNALILLEDGCKCPVTLAAIGKIGHREKELIAEIKAIKHQIEGCRISKLSIQENDRPSELPELERLDKLAQGLRQKQQELETEIETNGREFQRLRRENLQDPFRF